MCSEYDIKQKCVLGNLAFNNFKDIWLQGKRIGLCKLIKVYEAMVTSVIMYNCSSWAAPLDNPRTVSYTHLTLPTKA